MERVPTSLKGSTHKPRSGDFSSERAFTRIELLAVLTALGLLAATILPLLAGNRQVAERVACWSNLERVGKGWQSWLSENGEIFPCYLPPTRGGILGTPQVQNAFASLLFLSNHLASPRYLVCPADTETVLVAPDWPAFNTSYYRGNALSYTVGTDCFISLPESMLSSDHHLLGTSVGGCSVGARTLSLVWNNPAIAWNGQAVHGDSGNLLKVDGSVLQCSGAGLRAYLDSPATDNNRNHHFLPPR